ncbi:MAG: hypothetical protein EOO01_38285 [Chitinophagaceae bacterium]|nr:MAG: hypothetical protein EOO01_38285 [Chitinophagaceae bacterium]
MSSAAVWYIIGTQTNVNAFNNTQSDVELTGSSNASQPVFPSPVTDFTTFSLPENVSSLMADLDPLTMPFGRVIMRAPGTILLKQRIGKISTDDPMLFFANAGAKKAAYLFGEGIWRWRLVEDQENNNIFFDDLISNTMQYLAVKDDKRKFKVFPSKISFDENERILLNANLFNDNYAPVNGPEVNVVIKDEIGRSFNFSFSRTTTAYRLDAGNLAKGRYRFAAETVLGGKKLRSEGAFFVREIMTEFQQTVANHQLLNAISQQTNGKLYTPADLLQIEADLEKSDSLKTLSYEDRKYEDLINIKWLFFLLLLLLTGEWFLRKRVGEI